MKPVISIKGVAITLLAVSLAIAFADEVRQVKKQTSRGWLQGARNHYGPYVRDSRAWNSRVRVGRMSPSHDSFIKKNVWGPRPNSPTFGAEKKDFARGPEEIEAAFDEAKDIDDASLEMDEADDIMREILDYVKHTGQK